jgi:uncharacterized damage-inducible protein DinB
MAGAEGPADAGGGVPVGHIVPLPGFAPGVGRLACMLQAARQETLRRVAGLSCAQLDHRADAQSNSIGALLAHLAAVEVLYQVVSFEERDPAPDEIESWEPGLSLGAAARQRLYGRELESYTEALSRIRAATLERLASRDDAWLERELPAGIGTINQYWIWYHVLEDELGHRGQITWLRKRLP